MGPSSQVSALSGMPRGASVLPLPLLVTPAPRGLGLEGGAGVEGTGRGLPFNRGLLEGVGALLELLLHPLAAAVQQASATLSAMAAFTRGESRRFMVSVVG